MFDDYEEDDLLEEIREEKGKSNLKNVLNKKKVSKWEMDDAMIGEM